jgi:hypothetical protein
MVHKFRRPVKMAGRGEGVMVRFHHNGLIEQLDEWRAKQDDKPSRLEAIRRLLTTALA